MASERPEFSLRTTTSRVRPSRGTWTVGDRGARSARPAGISRGDRDEVEGGPQPVEGGVGAAVVDDHDLVPGIAQGEQRLHRGDDAGLLVVRRAR